MNDTERHEIVQWLGKKMSDISEDCYHAGWLGDTEYFVPELCRRAIASGQNQAWGHGEISPELAKKLVSLAELVGCWANTDYYSIGYDAFQPFPIPQEILDAIDREKHRLR